MEIIAISYSSNNEISRWDQSDLDIVLVNGDTFYKTLGRLTLLTAEDLSKNLELSEETLFPRFRENKYKIFDQGQLGNDNFLDNLVQNPEIQKSGSVFLFKVCFAGISFNSNSYIFDSHNLDNVGQSLQKVIQFCLSLSQLSMFLSS